MSNQERRVRVPFQPLSHSLEHLAQENELMIDYDNGNAYIRKGMNNIQVPSSETVDDIYNEKILELIGDTSYDTLKKIEDLIIPLQRWKDEMTNDDFDNLVNNLKDILDKFKDMSENEDTLVNMLLKKVDIEPGKGLSTNDFTEEHKIKLDNIEEKANKYKHPLEKQCNYEAPVKSVNKKIGKIVLTKNDIKGLENVDPNANNYKHPQAQQCSYRFPVSSVNSRDGSVTISKDEIKLDKVKNYQVASVEESSSLTINNKYLTVKNMYLAIENLILLMISD